MLLTGCNAGTNADDSRKLKILAEINRKHAPLSCIFIIIALFSFVYFHDKEVFCNIILYCALHQRN